MGRSVQCPTSDESSPIVCTPSFQLGRILWHSKLKLDESYLPPVHQGRVWRGVEAGDLASPWMTRNLTKYCNLWRFFHCRTSNESNFKRRAAFLWKTTNQTWITLLSQSFRCVQQKKFKISAPRAAVQMECEELRILQRKLLSFLSV